MTGQRFKMPGRERLVWIAVLVAAVAAGATGAIWLVTGDGSWSPLHAMVAFLPALGVAAFALRKSDF